MSIIYILAFLFCICFIGSIILPVIQVFISKEEIDATIIEVNEERIYTGNLSTTEIYYPIFEYYINGEKYIKQSYSGCEKNIFRIGEKVKIKYPKNRPEDAFLARDGKSKVITGIGIIIFFIITVIISYIFR